MKSLALVWAHLGGARSTFLTGLTLMILDGLLMAIPPIAVGLGLIRLAEGAATPQALLPYALAIPAAILLRLVTLRRGWARGFRAGYAATEAIRGRIVEHLQRVPLSLFHHWPQAKLATLISEDTRWVQDAATYTLAQILSGVTTSAVLLAVILANDMVAGLVLLALLIGAVLLLGPVTAALNRLVGARNAEIAAATQRFGEYADGIAVFRSFGQTGKALGALRAVIDRLHDLLQSAGPKMALLTQTTLAVIALAAPLTIAITAALVAVGLDRAGADVDRAQLIISLFLILPTVNAFATGIFRPRIILGLAERGQINIRAFLAEPVLDGAATAPDRPFDIGFEAVTFRYAADKPNAIESLGFVARQGEVTAIVGPSGAGKSTLISLLLRFFDPDAGRVVVGGRDLKATDPAEVQRLVSLVGQDAFLFRDTVRANILLGDPTADADRVQAAITAAQLEEPIAALPDGLDTMLGDTGRTLSGGERQRIAIARALLKDAPIVVLDEATSAVDPLTERAIQRALMTLMRDRTVILIAHRLHTIREADQIVVMDGGRVAETGRHDALLHQGGPYARLWQAQCEAAGWRLK